MNVTYKEEYHSCTSCQMCAAVCPTKAIDIQIDNEGFYKPIVDEEKCIDCSLCVKTCYKYNYVKMTSIKDLSNYDLYSAAAKCDETLKTTTSGGVAHIIAKYYVEKGYKCIGVEYDYTKQFAKHSIVSTVEDIDRFKGSKYIQSYALDAFKHLVNNNDSTNYIVFGTPCQIYALSVYLERVRKRSQYILIDIYCHGCPSLFLWHKYLNEVTRKELMGEITSVSFRDKKITPWGKFSISISDNTKTILSTDRKYNEFYDLFFSNHMLNSACTDCKLRSTLEYTDIRLGDFWGNSYDLNTKGVSSISLVTEKGRRVFEQISPCLNVRKHEFSEMLPFQSWGVNYNIDLSIREYLLDNVKEVSLNQLVSFYMSKQPLRNRIKRYMNRCISILPASCVNLLKYYYHCLKLKK